MIIIIAHKVRDHETPRADLEQWPEADLLYTQQRQQQQVGWDIILLP